MKGLSKKLKKYIGEHNLLFFHIYFVAVTLNLFELSVEQLFI